METVQSSFCVKEMDRNDPIKSSPQRPIKSGASAATCVLGFSLENACDWLVGLSRAFPAIIDWLVGPCGRLVNIH